MDGHLRYSTGYRNNEDTVLAANKFPWKLWKIVNGCRSGAIHWSPDGRNVVMDRRKFQREYLDPQRKTFKTNHIGSFVRQLNLYGFKKVQPACKQLHGENSDQEIQEFHNEFFIKGRPDLVHELRRHVGVRRAKQQEQAARRHSESRSLLGSSLYAGTRSKSQRQCFHNSNKKYMSPTSSLHSDDCSDRPRSMVAVPIYSDGIPYIHPSMPPVLVEWDITQKKWVARGPINGISVIMNGAHSEGARLSIDSDLRNNCVLNDDFSHLVNAVSDAIRDIPEYVLERSAACFSRSKFKKVSSRSRSPHFADDTFDESPFPVSFCGTKQKIRPGESVLKLTSSPNSPAVAEIAPDHFDELELSPIIVPCEQALVQAALGSTSAMKPLDEILHL